MRGFTERPKSQAFTERPKTVVPSDKRSFTSDDLPKDSPSMRRANTNGDLVSMESGALGTAPPQFDGWAHKQLMGMVNRSADGNRVAGEDNDLEETLSPISRSTAFAEKLGTSPQSPSALEHANSTLGHSQQMGLVPPRTLISSSSTSALPIGNIRKDKTNLFENRLRLKRERDQHMARMIVEEEHKKAKDRERDREKLREAEERMKAKAVREQQEQRLHAYYDMKQPQSTSPSNGDDNLTYFRSMKKKIKDINVKPNLPSIGLDEKLKKLNTRVKGFLSTTNPPTFSLPIPKLRDKRSSKQVERNMPIKLNIVDDFMKDLEMQRTAEDSSIDSRDGLSPIPPESYDIRSSSNSSPSDLPPKQLHRKRLRKRMTDIRLASKGTSELQLLVRALNQDVQANNEAIIAAQQTCAKIRAEMEQTKAIFTVDVETAGSKISRANTLGTQFVSTVKDIRTQLDTTRVATSSCSDQIKQLEVHVQKVQRAKKPTDKLVRYCVWLPISILFLYFVIRSPTLQMLVVIAAFVGVMHSIKDKSASAAEQLAKFQETPAPQYDTDVVEDEPEEPADVESSGERPPATPSTSLPNSPLTTKSDTGSGLSSIRRNHSDLVLQSLLTQEEFAEVINETPKLRTLKEDESMGISPKTKSKSFNYGITKDTQDKAAKGRSGAPGLRGPLRTSANSKDSVAMNLALHNLNQMSLKIQQMQQGK